MQSVTSQEPRAHLHARVVDFTADLFGGLARHLGHERLKRLFALGLDFLNRNRRNIWRKINAQAIGVEGARELIAGCDEERALEKGNGVSDGKVAEVKFGLCLGKEAHSLAWEHNQKVD